MYRMVLVQGNGFGQVLSLWKEVVLGRGACILEFSKNRCVYVDTVSTARGTER